LKKERKKKIEKEKEKEKRDVNRGDLTSGSIEVTTAL